MTFCYKKKAPRVKARTPGSYKADFVSLDPTTITIPVRVKRPRRN